MEDNIQDLRINGNSTAAGGAYRNVRINGSGTFQGDVSCQDIRVNGVCAAQGSVRAKSGGVNGHLSVKRDLVSDTFGVNGLAEVGGNVETKLVRTFGQLVADGRLAAETVENRGFLRVGGDCEAESFDSQGAFEIKGMLNAGAVRITLHGGCSAREIGGEKIDIRKGAAYEIRKFLKAFIPSIDMDYGLRVDSVEGDDVYLEYTQAKAVRGSKVQIGPGCSIGTVEYRTEYRADPGSTVGSAAKA